MQAKGIIQNFEDLSDSKEILESRPFPFAIAFIYLLLTILLLSLTWAYFSEIDIVVKSRGVVRPYEDVSTLTAKVSGKLSSKQVPNGDLVSSGDLLFTINHEALQLQADTLAAEIEKYTRDKKMTERMIASVEQQQNLFTLETERDYYQQYVSYEMERLRVQDNIRNLRNKVTTLRVAVSGYDTFLHSLTDQTNHFTDNSQYALQYKDYVYSLQALKDQSETYAEDYEAKRKLHTTGVVSNKELETARKAYEQAQNTVTKYKNETLLTVKTELTNKRASLFEFQTELNKLTPEARVTAGYSYFENQQLIALKDQLDQLDRKLDQLTSNLNAVQLDIESCYIYSPISGVLNMDRDFATADFIAAGTILGTVVPAGEQAYEIQLTVPNKDISNLSEGDPVKFRFDALPYKEYGMLEGQITQINADASVNQATGQSYYLVNASVQNRPLVSYKGKESTIKVGMTLEGHVITARKKILFFLLDKIDL